MLDEINKTYSCLSQEQLQAYLQEQVNPEEKHQIEHHLIDCPLCSSAMEGFNHQALDLEDQAILQLLKSNLTTDKETTTMSNARNNNISFGINQIAATLLLMVIPLSLFMYWNHTTNERAFSRNYEALTYDKATRGSNAVQAHPFFKNAMESYQNKHYEASLSQFEELFELEKENPEAMLYAGIAALEAGYLAKAENYLTTVRINEERNFDEATWYLALNALKREDVAETHYFLEELLQDTSGFYYKKAKELKVGIK